MDDIEKVIQLRRLIEQKQRKMDRSQGALEQIREQLKIKFGCSSLEEAKRKLLSLKNKEKLLQEDLQESIQKFEEMYGDKLNAL